MDNWVYVDEQGNVLELDTAEKALLQQSEFARQLFLDGVSSTTPDVQTHGTNDQFMTVESDNMEEHIQGRSGAASANADRDVDVMHPMQSSVIVGDDSMTTDDAVPCELEVLDAEKDIQICIEASSDELVQIIGNQLAGLSSEEFTELKHHFTLPQHMTDLVVSASALSDDAIIIRSKNDTNCELPRNSYQVSKQQSEVHISPELPTYKADKGILEINTEKVTELNSNHLNIDKQNCTPRKRKRRTKDRHLHSLNPTSSKYGDPFVRNRCYFKRCYKHFSSPSKRRFHMKMHQSASHPHVCKFCGKYLNGLVRLADHMKCHRKQYRKCKLCLFKTLSRLNLQLHNQKKHQKNMKLDTSTVNTVTNSAEEMKSSMKRFENHQVKKLGTEAQKGEIVGEGFEISNNTVGKYQVLKYELTRIEPFHAEDMVKEYERAGINFTKIDMKFEDKDIKFILSKPVITAPKQKQQCTKNKDDDISYKDISKYIQHESYSENDQDNKSQSLIMCTSESPLQNEGSVYMCLVCSVKFSTLSKISCHVQRHLRILRSFNQRKKELDREEKDYWKEKFKCPWCQALFVKEDHLEKHVMKFGSEETNREQLLRCSACGYSCQNKCVMLKHELELTHGSFPVDNTRNLGVNQESCKEKTLQCPENLVKDPSLHRDEHISVVLQKGPEKPFVGNPESDVLKLTSNTNFVDRNAKINSAISVTIMSSGDVPDAVLLKDVLQKIIETNEFDENTTLYIKPYDEESEGNGNVEEAVEYTLAKTEASKADLNQAQIVEHEYFQNVLNQLSVPSHVVPGISVDKFSIMRRRKGQEIRNINVCEFCDGNFQSFLGFRHHVCRLGLNPLKCIGCKQSFKDVNCLERHQRRSCLLKESKTVGNVHDPKREQHGVFSIKSNKLLSEIKGEVQNEEAVQSRHNDDDQDGAPNIENNSTMCSRKGETPYDKKTICDDKMQCNVCGKWVESIQALKRHLYQNNGCEVLRNCIWCDQKFVNNQFLEQHIRTCHPKQRYICIVCKKEFAKLQGRLKHQKSHLFHKLPKEMWKDEEENEVCISKELDKYKTHKNKHNIYEQDGSNATEQDFEHNNRKDFCDGNTEQFVSYIDAFVFEKKSSASKAATCKLCGKFVLKTYMEKHFHKHNLKQLIPSGNLSNQGQSLKGNMFKNKEQEIKFYDKQVVRAGENGHENSSLKKTKYDNDNDASCSSDTKEQQASNNNVLEQTKKLNNAEQTRIVYLCRYCNKMFVHASRLRAHESRHEGTMEKRHTCQTCGKRFHKPSDLRVHEVIHTGAEPFQCLYCGRTFNRISNKNRHERTHLGLS